MKHIIFGLIILSLVSCASLEEQKQLKVEAEQLNLGDNWWRDDRSFNSLEEAKRFVDVLFVKVGQSTKLTSSKGLSGILKPAGTDNLWTPAGDTVSVRWNILIAKNPDEWLDLSKDKKQMEELGFCHSAILYTTVWYKGKGIVLSWYGITSGWAFSNNAQLSQWNNNTICEYPGGLSKTKAWEYLGYTTP